MKPKYQQMLRRFTVGDERALGCVMSGSHVDDGLLDDKTRALVRLASLLAIESDAPSLRSLLSACQTAGVERQEVFAVADAVAAVIGEVKSQKATISLQVSLEGSGSKATSERP